MGQHHPISIPKLHHILLEFQDGMVEQRGGSPLALRFQEQREGVGPIK